VRIVILQNKISWIGSEVNSQNTISTILPLIGLLEKHLLHWQKQFFLNLPADFTSNPVHNVQMGISKAKQNMGIPELIDAEDMVYHAEELANMTYLSYLRYYQYLESRRKEHELLEHTPFSPKCITCGPGIKPGNSVQIPTNFTIEARNPFGRKIPVGGHHFSVKIVTSTGYEIPTKTTDNNEGTYTVEYTPLQHGNHTIIVTYQGQSVHLSPFQVVINPAEPVQGNHSTEGCEFTIHAVHPKT